MDVFIQSRKRVWNLDDSRDESKTVKENDFIENLVIGFFATIFGSILGVGFFTVYFMD